MRYPRGDVYVLVENRFDGALHPEILRYRATLESVGAQYTTVRPQEGESVVALCKRIYKEADAYWLVASLNDVLSPFAPLERPVKVPAADSLEAAYAALLEGRGP